MIRDGGSIQGGNVVERKGKSIVEIDRRRMSRSEPNGRSLVGIGGEGEQNSNNRSDDEYLCGAVHSPLSEGELLLTGFRPGRIQQTMFYKEKLGFNYASK